VGLRAQGTIEYLLIIGIVIVLSLVVVGFVLTQSGSVEQSSVGGNKLAVSVQSMGVTESLVDRDGNFVVRLLNNSGDVVTVSKVSVGGEEVYFSEDLAQGSDKFFRVNLGESCEEGKVVSKDLVVTYVTRYGLTKTETYPAKVMFNCSDFVINATFLANSCVSNASTIEPNLLPQNIWRETIFGVTGYWGVHSGLTKCSAWNGSTWIEATSCSDVNVPPNQDASLDSDRAMFDTEGRFVAGTFADGNKYVRDTWNDLMWWDGHSAGTMDWNEAIYYCENFAAGGYSDWRLATVAEAYQSFDYGASDNGGSNACAKGFTDCFGNWVWTSSTLSWSPTIAYLYYPSTGGILNVTRTSSYYARCVRSES